MRRHAGVENYMCDQCDASYFTASALGNHKVDKHMEVKETFLGTFCGIGFTKKANLMSHITLHTGREVQSDSVCEVCGKIFDLPTMKRRHVSQVHVGVKPCPCTWEGCDRSFTSKAGIERHLADHTGDLPFICPECPKKFESVTELNQHAVKHVGPRMLEKIGSVLMKGVPKYSKRSFILILI